MIPVTVTLFYILFVYDSVCDSGCVDEDHGNDTRIEVFDKILDDQDMVILEGGDNRFWSNCEEENNCKYKWMKETEWDCENCTLIDGRNIFEETFCSKSKLIAEKRVLRCARSDYYVSSTVSYSGGEKSPRPRITKVVAYNLLPEMGYARIAKGGIEDDHVELQLRSEKSSGFSYQIEIYGET